MILFVDFDGVAHAKDCDREQHFCKLPLLESLLREPGCGHADVVVSSTWRHAHSLHRLRQFFSADIRPRIVGVTPFLEEGEFLRYREFIAGVRRYRAGTKWVAVDDDRAQFPRHVWHRVVMPDSAVGLTPHEINALRALIARATK